MAKKLILFFILSFSVCSPLWAGEEFPFLAEITSDNVNVRAGQNQNFETVCRLPAGSQVVVVDKQFSWYKIKLPDEAESYVSNEFIKDLGQNVGQAMGRGINIRAGAGTNYSVLGQLKKGQWIIFKEQKDGWYLIEPVDRSFGWVSEEFVEFKSQTIPEPRRVQPPTKNIYAKQRQEREAVFKKQEEERAKEETARSREEAERAKWFRSATGVIRDLEDQSVSENIRHKIIAEDQTVYYLMGYRRMLDGFLHHKMKIEGKLLPDIQAPHPVLLVTRMELIL